MNDEAPTFTGDVKQYARDFLQAIKSSVDQNPEEIEFFYDRLVTSANGRLYIDPYTLWTCWDVDWVNENIVAVLVYIEAVIKSGVPVITDYNTFGDTFFDDPQIPGNRADAYIAALFWFAISSVLDEDDLDSVPHPNA